MTKDGLRAAAVEIDITPPVGVAMEGYTARKGRSQGIHDPLRAQALLLEAGDRRLLFFSLDLLGISLEITESLRLRLKDELGLDPAGVMIACSHTHAGPAGFLADVPGLQTAPDPVLREMLERKLAGAALEADARLAPARLALGRGQVHGLGANRNDPEQGPFDSELILLRVDDIDGRPLAVIFIFGCHPTVLGHENLLLSAEFPGAARAALRRIYPQTIFLFANGASGDISTRFTRREQTFREVERLGHILAGSVIAGMNRAEPIHMSPLGAALRTLSLPLRRFPPPEDLQATIDDLAARLEALKAQGASHGEIRRIFTQWQGAVGQAQMGEMLRGRETLKTHLQAFCIGPLAIVGFPGEPFTRLVLDMKRRSPTQATAVISYCNDEKGYFPDRQAFDRQTYEALISPYGPDVGAWLVDQAVELIQEVFHA